MPATDVNGKPLVVGDMVNVVCKITKISQVTNFYRLDLDLKYKDSPEDIMIALSDVNAKQVIKAE